MRNRWTIRWLVGAPMSGQGRTSVAATGSAHCSCSAGRKTQVRRRFALLLLFPTLLSASLAHAQDTNQTGGVQIQGDTTTKGTSADVPAESSGYDDRNRKTIGDIEDTQIKGDTNIDVTASDVTATASDQGSTASNEVGTIGVSAGEPRPCSEGETGSVGAPKR